MLQEPVRRLLVTLGIFLVNILLAEVPVNCLIMLEVVVLGVVPVLAAEDDTASVVDRGVIFRPAGLVKSAELRQLHLVVAAAHRDDAQHSSVSLQRNTVEREGEENINVYYLELSPLVILCRVGVSIPHLH